MDYFKNKKFDKNKLLKYGFVSDGNIFKYSSNIMGNDFILNVEILEDGKIFTKLFEVETQELYTLHLTDVEGSFVGQVRDEYEKILKGILFNCCDENIFKSIQAHEIIEYIKKRYDDEMEYLWEKFPDNAIARRKDNKKWYLAILTVGKDKLGFSSNEKVEVIDLRSDAVSELVKQENIYPGYHMNKKHWVTVILDGSMDIKKIYELVDISYNLAKKT